MPKKPPKPKKKRMINLALCLIHNKNAAANRNQINTITALTTTTFIQKLDVNGIPISGDDGLPRYDRIYTITGVTLEHQVKFYQILPFGTSEPNNLRTLDSYKVFYGHGDNDKIGTHPRFHNWSIKRGWDHGADIVALVTDHNQFTAAGLQLQMNRLINRRLLVIPLWGIAINVILFREIGQFREDLGFSASLDDLRARIIARGWESD